VTGVMVNVKAFAELVNEKAANGTQAHKKRFMDLFPSRTDEYPLLRRMETHAGIRAT